MLGLLGFFQDLEGQLRCLVPTLERTLFFLIFANERAAAMGGTYAFVSTASANLRQKNDAYNPGLGGFFAGALVGLRSTSNAYRKELCALLLILLGRPSHTICSRKWNSSWCCPRRSSVYWGSRFFTTVRPIRR